MPLTVYTLQVTKLVFKNYCYVIVDENSKQAVLVDPAWQFDTVQQTLEQAQARPIAVLLTHHHMDHINLANKCAKHFDIPVFMSQAEIDTYHFRCLNLQPLPTTPQFLLGTILIHAISTPGHTQGSTCFLVDNALFTGDTLFNEGCGICVGKGACPRQMFASLSMLQNTLSDDTLIFPGHRYGSELGQTFAFVKNNNIYLQLKNQEEFVAFRMRKGQRSLKKIFAFK